MALVYCPECKHEISSKASSCTKCGFPIAKFLKDNNLDDFEHLKICPKCGCFNSSNIAEYVPVRLKCKYCNTMVVQTDLTEEDYENMKKEYDDEKERIAYICNKYGGNVFSSDSFDYRVETLITKPFSDTYKLDPDINVPTCPTCGSHNIKKITGTTKASNAILFGLFGNKRTKQFHCNTCGYEW